jgi:hypothetical protein
MDVLTTILTCSLYLADDDLVRAIAESTSASNPYFVLDGSADWTQVDPPPIPKDAPAAVARTTEILSKGGKPLLGLLEVPPVWMNAFGRDFAAAFDPCTNLAVGTAMLSQFDFECSAKDGPKAARSHASSAATRAGLPRSTAHRRCVLSKYEAAIGSPDFAATTLLELRVQRTARPSVEAAPIFAPVRERRWGPDELFVPPFPAPASDP